VKRSDRLLHAIIEHGGGCRKEFFRSLVRHLAGFERKWLFVAECRQICAPAIACWNTGASTKDLNTAWSAPV
jgi:hypothetical protein